MNEGDYCPNLNLFFAVTCECLWWNVSWQKLIMIMEMCNELLLYLYLIGCCVLKESMTQKRGKLNTRKQLILDAVLSHMRLRKRFHTDQLLCSLASMNWNFFTLTHERDKLLLNEWMNDWEWSNPCPCSSYLPVLNASSMGCCGRHRE